jgi:hypothetical protein
MMQSQPYSVSNLRATVVDLILTALHGELALSNGVEVVEQEPDTG